ncbi:MAG: hypothetical protein ACFFGZ_06665 [Candidatus Thorarchaeota archaeon]
MGKKRFVVIIFLIIIGIIGVLAIDLFSTAEAIREEGGLEVSDVDAKASSDYSTMELTISLQTKSGGFLEKTLVLNLELTDVRVNKTISTTFEFALGSEETKTKTVSLDPAQTAELSAYPFLGFEVDATFSIKVLDFEIPAEYPLTINPILVSG